MKDIWGFLLQTVNISTIAAVMLILKTLLRDKLPPRWQYHVWYLLAVCMVIPAGSVGGVLVPQLHVLIQMAKNTAESGMLSVFTSSCTAVYNTSVMPAISAMPASITDWIMIIYTAGVILTVLRYIAEYIKLKRIISHAQPADAEISAQINSVAEKYSLKSCPAVTIGAISSAFVTGIKSPVLVLPQNQATDDKIILHELLHLQHHDLWQNILWALLFSLHWANPFMHYILSVIHNDMESLCDQRVLELLEGEDRREYGRTLLSMANDSYPSAFGTTSISNGGRFIAQRIEAIARFRKYPKGVQLVSVCMAVMMLPHLINGNSGIYPANMHWNSGNISAADMAKAVLVKHMDPYAAVDTYIKGLRENNRLYQLSVMPADNLKDFEDHIIYTDENIFTGNTEMFSYYILNMAQQADDVYTADIAVINEHPPVSIMGDKFGVLHYEDGTVKQLFETNGEMTEEQQKIMREEMSARYADVTVIPVKMVKEYGWKIDAGDIQHIDNHRYKYSSALSLSQLDGIYPRKTVQQNFATGKFTAKILPITVVVNSDNTVKTTVNINTWYSVKINYTFADNSLPQEYMGMIMDDMSSPSVKSDLEHLINDEIWDKNNSTLYSYGSTDYGARLICSASELMAGGAAVYYTTYENYTGANLKLTETTGAGIRIVADGAKVAEVILDLQAGEIYDAK